MDDYAPHLSPRTSPPRETPGSASGLHPSNVELAYVPTNASWLNWIKSQFQALRYFALDGADHRTLLTTDVNVA